VEKRKLLSYLNHQSFDSQQIDLVSPMFSDIYAVGLLVVYSLMIRTEERPYDESKDPFSYLNHQDNDSQQTPIVSHSKH
jgi:hypothetical protein